MTRNCDTCQHRRVHAWGPACAPCKYDPSTDSFSHWIPVPKQTMFVDNDCNPAVQKVAAQIVGRKDDAGKLDVTLFFNDLPHAIEGVTEVLQWAVTKKSPEPYERGSWQNVSNFQQRYQGAQLRHELNRAKAALDQAPEIDEETKLLELQHIATDAMFRLEMALRKRKGLPTPEGA